MDMKCVVGQIPGCDKRAIHSGKENFVFPEIPISVNSSAQLTEVSVRRFGHYVFTRILRYSHALLDCVSLKAEVWTCPDMSGPVDQSEASIWNRGTGAAVDQLPVSQRHLSVHPNVFIFHLSIISGYLASQFG
ncbi:hypothetical protein T11_10115 [Trichinella zimbabwensis]|uniref:Uncharacterized protein n=1 Tax=Trichinella zimbabwensis TaxID=268475 RepID=A0A0V1HI60_9BILA|nr:hypothetical protein T11_10115 [Trichinella zimbabwensis]